MRSGELATLAGVTVRTLRHYHQVGLLTEPERGGNGYRSYDVHDLVRVLRIRRLASLGIPLDRMPGLLDDTDDAAAVLDDLDHELAEQIERLTSQRRTIAHLRDHRAGPDVPPELAPFFAAFARAGAGGDIARADREGSLLLSHLAGEAGAAQITEFYRRMSEEDRAPLIVDIVTIFEQLGPDSDPDDIDSLALRFADVMADVVGTPESSDLPAEFDAALDLVGEFVTARLNDQQRRALDQVMSRMSELYTG
ncbi:MerR family transcriptional regulator [Gordonia soli]|uniref:Putative MerR family transcriptional regulator n=1 Tax=Gordonia soli NBRC 108243 TaxID=1223545 RepID=M0QIV6_9ACTN|nr:MerR family transcriptional regulator [Gordonia soli]GAC68565.1 putative MerR family transcriptional regulator [Gordonia soli NBRC 108243]